MDAANAAANANAGTNGINFFQIEFSIFHCQFSSRYSKLGHTIHTFAFFFIAIVSEIKIFNFACNFSGEARIRSIKLGNETDTGFTSDQIAPKFIFADADWSNRANTGNNDSSFQNKFLLFLLSVF